MDRKRVDNIIQLLLEAGLKNDEQSIVLDLIDIVYLCNKAAEVFLSQPCLLKLQAPIKICGDILGQYGDLLQIFDRAGFPPRSKYLFLGNYTYHRTQSFHTLCLLLAYKIKYPGEFFLLRGEYDEYARIWSLLQFYDDYTLNENIVLPHAVTNCFNCMPVAAIIDKKIFCVHGGISPELYDQERIRRIQRPATILDATLIRNLLSAISVPATWGTVLRDAWGWDRTELRYTPKRPRTRSLADQRTFGPDIVSKFLEKHNLDLICQGGHVLENGIEFLANRELVSIFSAPNFDDERDPFFQPLTWQYNQALNYENNLNPANGEKKTTDNLRIGIIIDIDDSFMLHFLILHRDEKKTTDDSILEVQKQASADVNEGRIARMVKKIQGLAQDKATVCTVRIGHKRELLAVVNEELRFSKLENPTAALTSETDGAHIFDYCILKRERDDALKEAEALRSETEALQSEAEALRLKIQQLTASTSDSSSSNISYVEVQQATNNFDISMKIGEGGFAIVYKGFHRGTKVAIKTLRPERLIEQSGFDKEAAILSKVRHPNLVTLIGFCSQPFALVYDYLSKGSLEDRLACKDGSPPLTWQVRTHIISEIRSALIFLHTNKPQPIVHGDLKPDNIFLDANMVSKLGDFGICCFLDSSSTDSFYRLTDHPKGTLGYIDPEYLMTGRLTTQFDVYSFGVIIIRLVSGRPVRGIIEEARTAISKWTQLPMIDPSAGNWPAAQAKELIKLGLKCCDIDRKKRPELDGKAWQTVEATILNSLKSI